MNGVYKLRFRPQLQQRLREAFATLGEAARSRSCASSGPTTPPWPLQSLRILLVTENIAAGSVRLSVRGDCNVVSANKSPQVLERPCRPIVPPVGRNLYGKTIEQLKLAGQPVLDETDQSDADQPAPGLPTTWDDIAVGHLVIAQEAKWDGWWEAIVLARDGDMLTLKWRDYPWQSNVVRHAGTVALLKPNPVST